MTVYILDFPEKAPGKCVRCGANHRRDGRSYIDIGVSVPRYGVVYFCTICMTEIVNYLDWISPEQYLKLETECQTLLDKNINLETENAKLRGAFSELDFLDSSGNDNASNVESSQGSTGDKESRDTESNGNSRGSEKSPEGPPKPTDESGSSGVFSIDLASSV